MKIIKKDNAIPYEIAPNTSISSEEIQSQIDLAELGLENYTIAGFYADEEFSEEFDFSQELDSDTSIYVKLSEVETPTPETTTPAPEKDNTPKTGVDNKLGLAIFVIAISSFAITALKRK